MIDKSKLTGAALMLVIAIGFIGCGKSSSSSSSSDDADGGQELSAVERKARDAVFAEIQKRWIKKQDGWVMAKVAGVSVAPEHFLAQARELSLHHVEANDLDDSDRMNGIEWAGRVQFKKTPYREIGDAGPALQGTNANFAMRQPGVWTQWIDWLPEAVRVQKVKGKWQVNTDTMVLNGTMPTPDQLANMGVK